MAIARKLLLGIMTLVMALAPAVASAASSSAKLHDKMAAPLAMEHCHKAAAEKSTSSHCKHCKDDSSCTPDVCALKCFKVVADVAIPRIVRLPLLTTAPPARQNEPANWVARPPSPPPRT